MARAFLVVMDSVGIGGAPDADRYFNGDRPDSGSNTVAHIAQACADGRAEEGRSGPIVLPNLVALGLGAAVELASGASAPGLEGQPTGFWGAATETSPGKDTPSGHWELAGLPVPWDWHYFPDEVPAFPDDLAQLVAEAAGTDGILGNRHASGTVILADLGATHMKTGWPICYTSADSVFQIAAHEETFGLDRLLDLGADLDATERGATALHWAAWWGREGGVELLLERGADRYPADAAHGATPAQWAQHRGHEALARVLARRPE